MERSTPSPFYLFTAFAGLFLAVAPLSPRTLLFIGAIYGVGVTAVLAWSERQFLGPMIFLGVAFTFQIYGPAIDIALNPIKTAELTGGIVWAGKGMRLALIGMAFIFLGYIIKRRHSEINGGSAENGQTAGTERKWWDRERAQNIALVFVVIGILSFILFAATAKPINPNSGGVSAKRAAPSAFIVLGVQVGLIGGFMLLANVLTSPLPTAPSDYFILTIAWLQPVVFGIFASSRVVIFLSVSVASIMLYQTYGRPRILALAIGALAGLGLSGAIISLRPTESSPTLISLLDPTVAITSIMGAKRGGLPVLAQLLKNGQSIPPFLGMTIIQAPLRFLPDVSFLPEPVQVGNQLGLLLYGFSIGSPPTVIGDLYLNFRLPGVIVGGFVFGIGLAILSNMSSQPRKSEPSLVIYSILLVNIAFLLAFSSVDTATIRLLYWSVPLTIAGIYVVLPSFRQTDAPPAIQNSVIVAYTNRIIVGWGRSRTRQTAQGIYQRVARYGLFTDG